MNAENKENALLEALANKTPVVKECLELYGALSLKDYLQVIAEESRMTRTVEAPEAKEDVAEAALEYLTGICGLQEAGKVAAQLERQRLLLTANHQQPEFCAHVVQGNFLYEALLDRVGQKQDVIPIIACSTVNLCNRHFPRGLSIYHAEESPLKVPVFTNRYHEKVMAAMDAYDERMVRHGQKNLSRLRGKGMIGEEIYNIGMTVLEEDFLQEDTMRLKRYGEQSVLINRRLHHRMLPHDPSRFYYLEMEEITCRLLMKDLRKKGGLVKWLLLSHRPQQLLAENLNGKRACWDFCEKKGSFLFWGIDLKKRRYSLWPNADWTRLEGTDLSGNAHSFPVEEQALLDAMEKRSIMPGLFLSFLELYFMRDYQVIGGYFQKSYLQAMQQGLCKALAEERQFREEEAFIRKQASFYLSGPVILFGEDGKRKYPFGSLEVIEQGGCSEKQIQALLDMTVRQAHLNGLNGMTVDFSENL